MELSAMDIENEQDQLELEAEYPADEVISDMHKFTKAYIHLYGYEYDPNLMDEVFYDICDRCFSEQDIVMIGELYEFDGVKYHDILDYFVVNFAPQAVVRKYWEHMC